MEILSLTASLTLLVFTAVCAASDYLTMKIPNTLILCGLLCAALSRAGLCLGSIVYGLPDGSGTFAQSGAGGLSGTVLRAIYVFLSQVPEMAAGFLLPYLLLGILVILKMLGGGDVKLLSVIGLQIGWRGSLRVMWYSLLAAAGVSVMIVARRRNLAWRLEYLRRYLDTVLTTGKAGPYRSLPADGADRTGDDTGVSAPNRAGDPSSGEFAFAVPVMFALIIYMMK